MKKKYIFFLLCFLGIFTVSYMAMTKKNHLVLPTDVPSDADKMRKYGYLMSHLASVPVDEKYRPVHIFRNPDVNGGKLSGAWWGSGTALIKNGKPTWILTAAHVFSEEGLFHIVVISPGFSPSMWALESAIIQSPGIDIAVAKVGVTPKHIPKIWFGDTTVRKRVVSLLTLGTLRDGNVQVRSFTTGETATVFGTYRNEDEGVTYEIVDYDSVRGESGCGFIAPDGRIYVMNQLVVLNENQQKILGINKPRGGFYTLMTSVKL